MADPNSPNRVKRNGMRMSTSAQAGTLWVGFTGLLLLMAAIAIDSGRLVHTVASTSAALRKETRELDRLLDQLRADIHRSGTIVRVYLLEIGDSQAAAEKREFEFVQRRVNETLRLYDAK